MFITSFGEQNITYRSCSNLRSHLSLERNELLKTVKRLGRTLWKKWSGYHRRGLVETKMHCIKLLGDKLTASSFSSQVNEIHARVAVLNKFTELGRPHTQVVT